MIVIWLLLYWIVGIVFSTVLSVLDDEKWDHERIIMCSVIWPIMLAALIFAAFYIVLHDGVEAIVKWFMKGDKDE